MDYELFLRARSPSAEGVRQLWEALEQDPDLAGSGPRYRIEIPHGALKLRLHPDERAWWDEPPELESDTRYGLDLRVPGGANPRLAAAACDRAFAWAKAHGLTVYDPQLGREVRLRDQDAIVTRIGRLAEYLTDTVGLGADGGAQIDVELTRPAMPFRTKFYLALAASLAVLALLTRFCQ